MHCSICGDTIKPEESGWDKGHNAEPANSGRCCTICNDVVVLPLRLKSVTAALTAARKESQTNG